MNQPVGDGLNRYSARITQPRSQGASQAMLYGTGMTEEDMDKPQVGIVSVWYEGNPCNMHLLELAEAEASPSHPRGLLARDDAVGHFATIFVQTRDSGYD